MATKTQWLALHTVCLDTIRSMIEGISGDTLSAKVAPGDRSVGQEVNHVIQAEAYWLREVGIGPQFACISEEQWTETGFLDELKKIEDQYVSILDEKGLDPDILFGLSRVCHHALYHYVRAIRLRRTVEPEWSSRGGRWERAVDFIADLLIVGEKAQPSSD